MNWINGRLPISADISQRYIISILYQSYHFYGLRHHVFYNMELNFKAWSISLYYSIQHKLPSLPKIIKAIENSNKQLKLQEKYRKKYLHIAWRIDVLTNCINDRFYGYLPVIYYLLFTNLAISRVYASTYFKIWNFTSKGD